MMSVFSLDKAGLETVSRCLVCGSVDHQRLFDAKDTLHGLPGVWTVRRCSDCGHGFTSPRPDRTSITRYYPDDYSPFHSPIRSTGDSAAIRVLKATFGSLFDSREFVMPPGEPGVALEVGCGSGRFLNELVRRGWSARGLEPSARAAAHVEDALNLRVDVGTIDTARYPDEEFDLVVALMVLEHLHEPKDDARRISAWIRPGGWLMGSVPNCGSWEFGTFQADWYALQVPTHLSHFTSHSLSRLLIRAGFEAPKIIGQRNVSNLVVQLGRFLQRRRWPLAVFALDYPARGLRSLRLGLWPIAALLAAAGQAGRMTFLAQKPG